MEGAHEEEKGTKACGCSELQVPPCTMLYSRKQTMVPSRASCLAWVEELGPLKHKKTEWEVLSVLWRDPVYKYYYY